MEENKGLGRGSYIWGCSVHNTRIECLWYGVTKAFGQKWKNFFVSLESHHWLDVDAPGHIWLLHHLFLPVVNEDSEDWAQAWSHHKMQLKGERDKTPYTIYWMSMLVDGFRGLEGTVEDASNALATTAAQQADDEVGDIEHLGVDWQHETGMVHGSRLLCLAVC
ncbi:hypothetical protein K488DRAFT_63197 [Vararia minispora EC-137]|uniref:Uncharacterized protein n=1 Tax=Vararia minispora EC-137 TaxID=1314806 RepID=A0ACB8Q603_9AGAM|nr:hypothetical protein K488DRAFT_63197 [Vararia minispora EC-137]